MNAAYAMPNRRQTGTIMRSPKTAAVTFRAS